MIKVFLVEDEFVVREGIKNNIDWAGEGFLFCGEAADGELALPLILSAKPDIVITDISMPFMNGLELSRMIRNELPYCRILILSGHEDFAYAQEAIRIGVTQYLLKPINSAELTEVMKRLAKQILDEREEQANYERYKRDMAENEQSLRLRLFNEIVAGSLSIYQILEKGRELGLKLSAKSYQIMLLKYSHASYDESFSTELLTLTEQFTQLSDAKECIILFDRTIEGWAILIKAESPEQLRVEREAYLKTVKSLLSRYPNVRYFGGIGSEVDRLTTLTESFETAQRALAQRFLSERNDIVSYDPASSKQETAGVCSDMQELGSLDLHMVQDFLKGGETREIEYFVDKFLTSIGSSNERSLLFRQYVYMDIYVTTLTFLKNIGEEEALPEEPFSSPEQMNDLINNPEKAKNYLMRLFTEALKRRESLRTKRYHRIIDQARDYINEHYSNEDLSLNDVAEYVNISPSHFSSVFSRETGQSFIRYLTDQRMAKARDLLKCSDLRCSEIGSMVGYKDPHYFSYLFKKIHNCSPMQYRRSSEPV